MNSKVELSIFLQSSIVKFLSILFLGIIISTIVLIQTTQTISFLPNQTEFGIVYHPEIIERSWLNVANMFAAFAYFYGFITALRCYLTYRKVIFFARHKSKIEKEIYYLSQKHPNIDPFDEKES